MKQIRKIKINAIPLAVFLLFLLIPAIVAHGEEDFAKAEELIKAKISCNQLDDDQLELMGDYFMEQMHPGELHEIMDERMGGEGSETLRQAHVNMARSFYCGESGMMSGGMMNMMMGRNGFGSSGMMNGIYTGGMGNMMGNFGGYGMFGMGFFGWIFMLLILAALILLIIWLIKQIQKK